MRSSPYGASARHAPRLTAGRRRPSSRCRRSTCRCSRRGAPRPARRSRARDCDRRYACRPRWPSSCPLDATNLHGALRTWSPRPHGSPRASTPARRRAPTRSRYHPLRGVMTHTGGDCGCVPRTSATTLNAVAGVRETCATTRTDRRRQPPSRSPPAARCRPAAPADRTARLNKAAFTGHSPGFPPSSPRRSRGDARPARTRAQRRLAVGLDRSTRSVDRCRWGRSRRATPSAGERSRRTSAAPRCADRRSRGSSSTGSTRERSNGASQGDAPAARASVEQAIRGGAIDRGPGPVHAFRGVALDHVGRPLRGVVERSRVRALGPREGAPASSNSSRRVRLMRKLHSLQTKVSDLQATWRSAYSTFLVSRP